MKKILVIGTGSIGRRHALNARFLAENVAVYDLNQGEASAFAQGNNLIFFDALDSALSWRPEAVVISTPPDTHISLAKQALQANAHVLIEKPLSTRVEEVDSLVALANKMDKKVNVVCNMRFHPAVVALKKNLDRIGRILFARAYYGNYLPNMRPDAEYRKLYCAHKDQGGGVIFDVVHEVDYLTWFFGPVEGMFCSKEKLSDLDIDVEDYAEIIISHQRGVKSSVHVDYLQQCKRRGCEIVGTEGTLVWGSEGKNPESVYVKIYQKEDQKWTMLLNEKDMDTALPYKLMLDAFITGISDSVDGADLSTVTHAAHVVDIAVLAHKSASQGVWVAFDHE